MTEEEYLRACGWESGEDDAGEVEWTHERRPLKQPGRLLKHTTAEAVEEQIAEDRARYNFMRERSWMNGGLLVPIPAPSERSVVVSAIFQVKGRGTVAVLDPFPKGVSVNVGDTLRGAVGAWVVSGIETGPHRAVVLRGAGEPTKGERLVLERKET